MPGNVPGKQLDIKAIFNLARRIEPGEARAEYLRQVCDGDARLIDRVVALLDGHEQHSGFLESPPAGLIPTRLTDAPTQPLGTMIGPYKIREVLGEGGMGIVYVAEQEKPIRRKVALKVIKPGMDTREVIARFEAERQALALMDHPNIAKVLDAGTTGGEPRIEDGGSRIERIPAGTRSSIFDPPSLGSGRPYFVMELVRGLPINEYCDQRKLPTRERIKLFITVCQAVQHAHQKGIIHRDLKPSNVMITMQGETASPKVIDFGVAKALNQKLTEHTLYTRHAQLLGTPLYMSPEQAEMTSLDVDYRSDVYSLGVLLYELLTGTTPIDKETFAKVGDDEMRRMIREDEPPRPSHRVSTLAAEARSTISSQRGHDERQFVRTLRGELDWIVMKALEKDRTRRYGSADALAADLQRYLDNQPIQACPPSLAYRLQKFVSRERNALTAAAILAVCAPLAAYEVFKLISGTESISREQPSALPRIAVPSSRAPGRALPGLVPEPPLFSDVGRWQLITKKPRGMMRSAAWSPDETRFALAETNHVRIYDAMNLQLLHVLVAHSQPVRSVAWHPDGNQLASASEDGTVRLWTSYGAPTHLLSGHSGPVYRVAWRPDGEQLASASADGTIRLWTADGKPGRVLDEAGRHVFGIDWSPDGKLLASVGGDIASPRPDGNPGDNSLRLWDPDTGELIRKIESSVRYSALCVDWRPDGKQLAVGYGGMYRSLRGDSNVTSPVSGAGVRFWNIDGTPSTALVRESESDPTSEIGTIHAVAWNPAGTQLAFAGRLGVLFIWNAEEGRSIRMPAKHDLDLNSLAWNRDGSELLSASHWSFWVSKPNELHSVPLIQGGPPFMQRTYWSPDGQSIVVILNGGATLFWDADGKPQKKPEHSSANAPPWWEPPSETRRPDGTPGQKLEGHQRIRRWAWNKNGRLAGGIWDSKVRIWTEQGKLIGPLEGHRGGVESASWSPDGQWLATGGGDSVRLWKPDGTPGPVMTGHTDEVYGVAWSPDGKWIASGATDATVRLWKPDGTPGPVFRGHQGGITDVSWSPDSKRLASACWLDNTLRVWNVETGKTEWQALQLESNAVVTLLPMGQLLHGDRALLESNLAYLVETPDGSMEIVSFADFRKRFAKSFVLACTQRFKKPVERDEAEAALTYAATFQWEVTANIREEVANVIFSVADQEFHKGEYDEALRHLNIALQWNPVNSEILDHRGRILMTRGETEKALADFDAAILHGNKYNTYNPRGSLFAYLGKWDRARENFEKALSIDSGIQGASIRYQHALVCLAMHDEPAYRADCEELLRQHGESQNAEEMHSALWTVLLVPDALPEMDKVLDLAARAVELEPDRVRMLQLQGAALYRTAKYEDALLVLKQSDAATVDPSTTPVYGWYFRAMAHQKLLQTEDATLWFEKAVEETNAILSDKRVQVPWNRRLTLELLDREARTLIQPEGASDPPAAVEPPRE